MSNGYDCRRSCEFVPVTEIGNSMEHSACRPRLECDGTRAETRLRLSAKRTCPFKSAGATVQSTTGSQGVRISGSNAGYTMFRSSVMSSGYPLHSPVSPSFPTRASPCAITFQLDSTTGTRSPASQAIPRILWNLNVHHHVHISQPMVPHPYSINPVHNLPPKSA